MKLLSLKKSRNILQTAYSWYKKKSDRLTPEELAGMEQRMLTLESAIASGNREAASSHAESLEQFTQAHCKKSLFDYLKEIFFAVTIALALAVVVRQMWFELYEIPTGSMRPTFREQDRVAVSKTPFGINMPLSTDHFLFDPSLIVRGGAITFTSEGIDQLDEDTTFMWIIPYKKRLIKRLIGKPGDSLYFYGGKIYGIDKESKPINELLDAPWMHTKLNFDLEHIPIITFSKEIAPVGQNEMRFAQMGLPIGRLTLEKNALAGQIYNGKEWIKDDPLAQRSEHSTLKSYSDFFGMRNFATARLLTAKQVQEIAGINPKELPEGVLYLELSHHPSLSYPAPTLREGSRRPFGPSTLKTVIPLQQSHLDELMNHMYTARLVFKDGRAAQYSTEAPHFDKKLPAFPGVPDGTYEFYEGKLLNVGFGAITHAADENNPLYSRDPKNVQKLFNLGVQMHSGFLPTPGNPNVPRRYAYFRDGDLYLLGAPVLKKGDPTLNEFIAREQKKETGSLKSKPYTAFKDFGPPLKDGQYDVDFIRTFGVTVPDKHYLVLGDNHAMSGDSRDFGFVPEENLQGAPSLILWPAGERMGTPWQAPYSIFVLPRLIVWAIVGTIAAIWYYFHRKYLNRPIILKQHGEADPSHTG